MANQLLTISQITREGLMVLENNLAFANNINREYSSEFARSGAKIGAVVNVRKPPRYTVSTGPALQVQDATETYVPVTLTTQAHVDISFSSADLALHIDDFRDRFLKPAMAAIANKIDFDGLALYKKVANMVGADGTVPATALVVLQAGQRLSEEGAPLDDQRAFIVNPAAQAALVNGMTGLFNDQKALAAQYTKGKMATALGFNFTTDQNVNVHTYGLCTASNNPTVNGAQSGTVQANASSSFALTVNATNNTITEGTVVTLSNVYAVNPQNRQSTGALKQFVVTADAAGSATTLNIWPVPVFSGAFQNVTSTTGNIANGATVTLPNAAASSARAQNLAFHKDAFTLATADLPLPNGVDIAARESYKGISMRIWRQADINTDQFPCRIDVLYGYQALYPELAVRGTA